VSGGTITLGPPHVNAYGSYLGYGTSDKFMWMHLLDERGWHHKFPRALYPTAPETGFKHFSEKCEVAGCDTGSNAELYVPDRSIIRP
jgi:hypothetical protein